MQLTLEGETPLLPEGYRWLLRGERIQEGDLWADTEFNSWEPTKAGAMSNRKVIWDCQYIRKLTQEETVPFSQQSPVSSPS